MKRRQEVYHDGWICLVFSFSLLWTDREDFGKKGAFINLSHLFHQNKEIGRFQFMKEKKKKVTPRVELLKFNFGTVSFCSYVLIWICRVWGLKDPFSYFSLSPFLFHFIKRKPLEPSCHVSTWVYTRGCVIKALVAQVVRSLGWTTEFCILMN